MTNTKVLIHVLAAMVCLADGRDFISAQEVALPDLIKRVEHSVVRLEITSTAATAKGSGFLIEGGYVVTNYHVINDAISADVVFSDGKKAGVAGIRSYDALKDLAILELEGTNKFTVLPIARETPRKGENVVALGAPLGFSFTVTQGIVSAVRTGSEIKELLDEYDFSTEMTWIQTTAPISQGNSGGPLVNLNGEVVGVNSWTFRSGQNLNFSVSCRDINDLVVNLQKTQLIPLGSQPESGISELERKTPDLERAKEQLVYNSFAKEKFDTILRLVTRELEDATAGLQSAFVSVEASDEFIKGAELRYDAAVEKLNILREFDPGTPKLLDEGTSLIGEPGRWYVVQVIGPDSFLAKRDRTSDLLFCVKGVSTAGTVDGVTNSFDGVWYTSGETYMYQTVGGSTRTVYVIRGLSSDTTSLLEAFRKEHVKPTIDEVIASTNKPEPPNGEVLDELMKKRIAYRSEQATAEKLRREKIQSDEMAKIERRAGGKVKAAKARLQINSKYATELLREVVSEFPDTKAADEAAKLLLGGRENQFRTWRSGRYSTIAALVNVEDNVALLKKRDGKVVKVSIGKLSDEDQEFIAREMEQRKRLPVNDGQ